MNWAEITLVVICFVRLVAYAILDGKVSEPTTYKFSNGFIGFLLSMWLLWCAGVIH